MPKLLLRPCPRVGCHELIEPGQRACPDHAREADQRRGTPAQRGYVGTDWRQVRRVVITRDPTCTCSDQRHGHGSRCAQPSTVADHHPATRRELVDQDVPDPDEPTRLRGLCASCHSKHTAETSPGGWHRSNAG